jgi:hypothetical protein
LRLSSKSRLAKPCCRSTLKCAVVTSYCGYGSPRPDAELLSRS